MKHFLIRKNILIAAIVMAMLVIAVPAFAQSATPVPLNIPINEIFTQTNNWMTSLAPAVTPGVAIAIAMTLLLFVGGIIINAFKKSGKF